LGFAGKKHAVLLAHKEELAPLGEIQMDVDHLDQLERVFDPLFQLGSMERDHLGGSCKIRSIRSIRSILVTYFSSGSFFKEKVTRVLSMIHIIIDKTAVSKKPSCEKWTQ
jgi:hypothetical protein